MKLSSNTIVDSRISPRKFKLLPKTRTFTSPTLYYKEALMKQRKFENKYGRVKQTSFTTKAQRMPSFNVEKNESSSK